MCCEKCNKNELDCLCITNCVLCNREMPKTRLIMYKTCINCTNEKPYSGFMVYEHKTAGNIQLIKTKDKESLRRAKRANRRAR